MFCENCLVFCPPSQQCTTFPGSHQFYSSQPTVIVFVLYFPKTMMAFVSYLILRINYTCIRIVWILSFVLDYALCNLKIIPIWNSKWCYHSCIKILISGQYLSNFVHVERLHLLSSEPTQTKRRRAYWKSTDRNNPICIYCIENDIQLE